MKPKISVIIPAYNAEAFIGETLKSTLFQTYKDFEVVVVNDGSTDKTPQIVNEFAKNDKRIFLINKKNEGTASARNIGIEKARGELIAFLDSDDLWHCDKLAKQVSLLEKNSSLGIVSCLAVIINEEGKSQGLVSGRNLRGNCYRQMLEAGGISGGSIVLVPRHVFDRVGLFDSSVEPYEDWDMWVRISSKFDITTVPDILVGYRRSSSSASRNYKRLMNSGSLVLKKAFQRDPNLKSRYYKLCFARDIIGIGAWCFIDREYKESWAFVKEALKIDLFACLTDFHRLAFMKLLILSSILPKKTFEKIFMKNLIPKIFRQSYGELFIK